MASVEQKKTSEIPISSDGDQREDLSYRLVQLGHGFSLEPVSENVNNNTTSSTSPQDMRDKVKNS